jgi:hypothetical protein
VVGQSIDFDRGGWAGGAAIDARWEGAEYDCRLMKGFRQEQWGMNSSLQSSTDTVSCWKYEIEGEMGEDWEDSE